MKLCAFRREQKIFIHEVHFKQTLCLPVFLSSEFFRGTVGSVGFGQKGREPHEESLRQHHRLYVSHSEESVADIETVQSCVYYTDVQFPDRKVGEHEIPSSF